MAKRRWDQNCFARYNLEGLSQYTLRLYTKLADIEQDEKETPGKFLDNFGRLSESLLALILKLQRRNDLKR